MMGVSKEELYNLPTAEYVHRRGGFLNRLLTVYHVAFHACAELKDVQVLSETISWFSLRAWYSCCQLLFFFSACVLCAGVLVFLWLSAFHGVDSILLLHYEAFSIFIAIVVLLLFWNTGAIIHSLDFCWIVIYFIFFLKP